MPPEKPTDEALYARFRQHADRLAYEELVRRWWARAYTLARFICRCSELAEEAVQEAFLRLLSGTAVFHSQGRGSFRCWFLSVVTSCARTCRRSEWRAARKRRTAVPRAKRERKSKERVEARDREQWLDLAWALSRLESRWRVPVTLYFLEGVSQRELASKLGVSQQMVSRRIREGLELLRGRFAGVLSVRAG
jgi:RNA polymerase sigma-70 factor (ECF subfamily)